MRKKCRLPDKKQPAHQKRFTNCREAFLFVYIKLKENPAIFPFNQGNTFYAYLSITLFVRCFNFAVKHAASYHTTTYTKATSMQGNIVIFKPLHFVCRYSLYHRFFRWRDNRKISFTAIGIKPITDGCHKYKTFYISHTAST